MKNKHLRTYANWVNITTLKLSCVGASFLLSVPAFAADTQVGKMQGDKVSIKNVASRVTEGATWFVQLIGYVGIFLGALMFLTCLYNISKISKREKEGSVGANFLGCAIGCLMMAVLFWSFWGAALLTNSVK